MTYMYEDVRSRKFYWEDVLKKKIVSVLYLFFEHHIPTTEKKSAKKKKKARLSVNTHLVVSSHR